MTGQAQQQPGNMVSGTGLADHTLIHTQGAEQQPGNMVSGTGADHILIHTQGAEAGTWERRREGERIQSGAKL